MTDGNSSTTVAWLMKLANDIDTMRETLTREREERREADAELLKRLANLQDSANKAYTNLEQDNNRRLVELSQRINEVQVDRAKVERELRDLISDVESMVHRHKHVDSAASAKKAP